LLRIGYFESARAMATLTTISESSVAASADEAAPRVLVSLSTMPAEALDAVLANLAVAFADGTIDVATPDSAAPSELPANLRLSTYTPTAVAQGTWVLTAADYLNSARQVRQHNATVCLVLGPEAQTLDPAGLRALGDGVSSGADLVTARYTLGARDGLVNSAILYPATRALFGTRPRYPLAIDVALSARMAERLAVAGQKLTAASQSAALVWPVAEAAAAGFAIAEAPVGSRGLPPPDAADLNSLLAQVAGSFFADLDAKASFWQRARVAYAGGGGAVGANGDAAAARAGGHEGAEVPDVQPMLDSFRLAYTNLHEIWSLVLPPNSLLGLKKLSLMPSGEFRMADSLWARIVYDFVLAYRLRTINRGHLLGALTPLYLAWVASHLLLTGGTGAGMMSPEKHVEAVAAAFETDKPYLVARWRWPDRFNP
jgi:hypothetical protein